MKVRFVVLVIISCVMVSCSRKTEIIQLTDLAITNSEYALNRRNEQRRQELHFVVANPPKNKNDLLNLLLSHFQEFTNSDTIRPYNSYSLLYYRETRTLSHTLTRNFQERRGGLTIEDYVDFLIAEIRVETRWNRKRIFFLDRRRRIVEIVLPWEKDGEQHRFNQKKIIFFDSCGGVKKEQPFSGKIEMPTKF